MSKFIKRCLSILLSFSLVGCGSVPKLAEQYSEEEVLTHALEAIELVNEEDYDGLIDLIRDDLITTELQEALKTEINPIISKVGNYVEYTRYQTTSTKDENGYEYAVIAIICKYENGELTYTISLDENYELVGIFVH